MKSKILFSRVILLTSAPLGLLAALRENAPSSLCCNPEALNEIDHLNS
jgi:hypothetical protein